MLDHTFTKGFPTGELSMHVAYVGHGKSPYAEMMAMREDYMRRNVSGVVYMEGFGPRTVRARICGVRGYMLWEQASPSTERTPHSDFVEVLKDLVKVHYARH